MPRTSKFVAGYTKTAQKLLEKIEMADIEKSADLLLGLGSRHKVFLIGNGGSAGIASIVANRLWKFCGIKGHTFNDPVIMSCAGNDYGWESVFSEPLKRYGEPGDVLIAISSSGKSQNILNAVLTAQDLDFDHIVTLSGFDPINPLRKIGHTNFYVPSDSYRHVERTHLFILDCILDLLVERRRYS